MKKELYLPLALTQELENCCPRIFEIYEDKLRNREEGKLDFDIATQIGNKYFPIDQGNNEEAKNCALRLFVLGEWRISKQVYSFSKELYDLICEAEDFQIDTQIFEYLPYSCFYIEFENDMNIHGMFVKYVNDFINNDMCFIFLNNSGQHSLIHFNFKDGQDLEDAVNKVTKKWEEKENIRTAISFGFQACMYLCAKNCDIRENSEQQKIYKKNNRIKNKYSEIRKWDIGYRITKESEKSVSQRIVSEKWEETCRRNRPRQHWRRAHWHTYWVGKGRQKKD